jgi:cell filamentation protein, protein adenylyltransferase
MDLSAFTMPAGRLVPNPLPPHLELTPVQQLLSEADQKLGELRGIGRYLPNPYLLIRPLQRREAIASSNIEGTYTSLPELLMFESGIEVQPRAVDTHEVYNYIRALHEGIRLLDTLPISNRLIHALHKQLLLGLPKHRAGSFAPGEYRTEQNLIGKSKDISKSRFNPPPPPAHLECMNNLEMFINREDMHNIPALIFIAIIHYQFETIHPFPDGNGRVGRLLIPIILKSRRVMEQPLLYMSQFFEDNKDEYVELLLKVSQQSDWLSWIAFFLRGVVESSEKTIQTIHKVMDLQETYKQRCQQARSSVLLMQIIDSLFERIGITVPMVRTMTGTSYTAAQNNLNKLVEYGIVKEHRGRQRPKFYFAVELVDIFES